MRLDRNRPFGQTFGADAGTMPLFQDNVYYNVRGEVVDCHYNREHSPHLFAAAESADSSDDAPVLPPKGAVKVQEEAAEQAGVADLLASKSDAEIYTAALKLRAMLDEADDADKYVPDPTDKDQNVAFMLRHSGG